MTDTERAIRAICCPDGCGKNIPLLPNGRHAEPFDEFDDDEDASPTEGFPCTYNPELLPLFQSAMERARRDALGAMLTSNGLTAMSQELGIVARSCPYCIGCGCCLEDSAVTEHIKVCPKHPAREWEAQAIAGAYEAAAKRAAECWKEARGLGNYEFIANAILALTPADARQASPSNPLFVAGEFTSHSGLKLPYKIDCDALTDADMKALAGIIAAKFKFRRTFPVPDGGARLAQQLFEYRSNDEPDPVLIVDDVLTTGKSMEWARRQVDGPSIGVVIFARGPCPEWVTPLFVDGAAIASAEARGKAAGAERVLVIADVGCAVLHDAGKCESCDAWRQQRRYAAEAAARSLTPDAGEQI